MEEPDLFVNTNFFADVKDVLEIGGGEKPLYHPNLDIRKLPGVDIVADLNQKWPVPDGTVTGVFSMYAIEHVSWRKIGHFVGELFRVLRPGGRVVIITANLKAQVERLAAKDDFADEDLSMIFGDQNYEGDEWRANAHACGFSPSSAQKLFRQGGFSDVVTYPHPDCPTDMVIEAMKARLTVDGRIPVQVYNKDYFNGGKGGYGGYSAEGYQDFPSNWNLYRAVQELRPKSILELGSARGYLLKRFQDAGIPVLGLEASHHCYLTRAINGLVEWDVTQTPWPVKDRAFDLCLSVSFLEHIHESMIDTVIAEIRRTCMRGFHVVNFGEKDDGFDKTHQLFRDWEWWTSRFGSSDHMIHSEQDFNKITFANIPAGGTEVKLNLGSSIVMFHHGWTNIDFANLHDFARKNGYKFLQSDLSVGFPGAPSNSVILIHASHLIEHLESTQALALLRECHRVLAPNGLIRISCPDAKRLLQCYAEGRMGEFDEVNDGCAAARTQIDKLNAILRANHKVDYDEELLADLLKNAGFKNIQRRAFRESSSQKMLRETLDMFPCLSLYMEAIKD